MVNPEYYILLVDDDTNVLEGLVLLLEDDYNIITAPSGAEAIKQVNENKNIAVVVMDIKMSGMDGIEASREIKKIKPDIPIIFHTGFPGEYSEDHIDKEEKPFDYIQKGSASSKLTRSIKNGLRAYLLKSTDANDSFNPESSYGMIGKSALMKEVYSIIGKVAPSNIKVMILGETGTGKELVARAIHNHSKRKDNRLVIFNCNHKSPDLVESELFGHTKGSFTGAVSDREGLFEYADNGTIFLDEIGDLDITTQAKVLRVLESGEFQTIGETPELKNTDVRILCATHHNLEELVRTGKFREDLYYRLKGIIIILPPLRDRKEDIPKLIAKHTDKLTIEQDQMPKYFDQSAIEVFLQQDWPGNVRQLLDTVESLLILSDSDIILAADVEKYMGTKDSNNMNASSLANKTIEFRKNLIISILYEKDNNINATARELQIDPANLRKLIKSYNITTS